MINIFKNKEEKESIFPNERVKSAVILGGWLIFFIVVIVISRFSTPKSITSPNKITDTSFLSTNFDNTKNINYTVGALIKINNDNFLFNGNNSTENNKLTGYLLHENSSIYEEINDQACITGEFDKKGELINTTPCSEIVNYNYFNIDNIYSLINNKEATKISENSYLFNLSENKKPLKVQINITDKYLEKVIIKSDDGLYYELTYKID